VARAENPYIFIIARTRYVSEVEELIKSGANEVIRRNLKHQWRYSQRFLTTTGAHERYQGQYEEIRANNYKGYENCKLAPSEG